jgi:hypothetical protein
MQNRTAGHFADRGLIDGDITVVYYMKELLRYFWEPIIIGPKY